MLVRYRHSMTFVCTCRAVITGKDTRFQSIADLRGQTIGVSRLGSGSHIFANYMALREKWYADSGSEQVEKLNFEGERYQLNSPRYMLTSCRHTVCRSI